MLWRKSTKKKSKHCSRGLPEWCHLCPCSYRRKKNSFPAPSLAPPSVSQTASVWDLPLLSLSWDVDRISPYLLSNSTHQSFNVFFFISPYRFGWNPKGRQASETRTDANLSRSNFLRGLPPVSSIPASALGHAPTSPPFTAGPPRPLVIPTQLGSSGPHEFACAVTTGRNLLSFPPSLCTPPPGELSLILKLPVWHCLLCKAFSTIPPSIYPHAPSISAVALTPSHEQFLLAYLLVFIFLWSNSWRFLLRSESLLSGHGKYSVCFQNGWLSSGKNK